MKRFYSLVILLLSMSIHQTTDAAQQAAHPKQHPVYIIVNHPISPPGMFSILSSVLSCLDIYERGKFAGIEVDFGTRGLYYDPAYGNNWWEYYCEPIRIGS